MRARSSHAGAIMAWLLATWLWPSQAAAQAGVLIPWSVSREPDPSVLSMRQLDVSVRIEHLHATVTMRQVFENHTDRPLEGRYVLPLGERAGIESFSVWEGEERLVGVVVERQKGRRLFEQIESQNIDPALAETEDERDKGRRFALRVAPIAPRGTARIEVVWSEDLVVSSMGTLFSLPLKARGFADQRVRRVSVDLTLRGSHPIARAELGPEGLLRWVEAPRAGGTSLSARWSAADVTLHKDLTLELRLAAERSTLTALTYRDVQATRVQDVSPFGDGTLYNDQRGFFLLRALLHLGQPPRGGPRDVVVLLDTSLSMGGEKLERSVAAVEYFLSRLGPSDRFGLVLWNDEVRPFKVELRPGGAANVGEALRFMRESYLGGGTELGRALDAGAALLDRDARPGRERFLVLISDGQPTRGELSYRELGRRFSLRKRPADGISPARLFVLGVGDDASVPLLRTLAAAGNGYFSWAREGTDIGFKLRTFFDKLGQATWKDVALTVSGLAGVEQVLPASGQTIFDGSDAHFYGRYRNPGEARARLKGTLDGKPYSLETSIRLPEKDTSFPFVARGWATLRVEELLDRIAEAGEREEWVREIIALAKRFLLITPYTSLIAAPRALLRPRAIQPGDPLLRVKADRDIREIAALFPFGLRKGLRYLPDEDVWETRFLAPPWMNDGTYACTLILTDREGRKHREEKSFVIDSSAPRVRLRKVPRALTSGQAVELLVDADADTRRLTARLGDGPESELRWDPERKGSVGRLHVPPELQSGTYPLMIIAQDFAHNVSSVRVDVHVTPAVDARP